MTGILSGCTGVGPTLSPMQCHLDPKTGKVLHTGQKKSVEIVINGIPTDYHNNYF